MKLNLVVTGLTFPHKVVACHFMQYAAELLVLRGLTASWSPVLTLDAWKYLVTSRQPDAYPYRTLTALEATA
jgi:hypothetical protein